MTSIFKVCSPCTKTIPPISPLAHLPGRIYGDTKVTDCEVADVSVSSVSRMTGGFVGYVEGATRYDAVSGIVGTLTNVLSKILNVIPFLGLGDLVNWLLSARSD